MSGTTIRSRGRFGNATLIGCGAILLWSSLAWLTTSAVAAIPPFQLLAMAFGVAFCVSLVRWVIAGRGHSVTRIRWTDWILSVSGIFLYHFFYFIAFRHLPAVEANLLNYLWPLLIVLFSGFLPGEKLRGQHILGAVVAFAGAATVIFAAAGAGRANGEGWGLIIGYASALACAVTWAAYSVLNRRFGKAPTVAVGAFCGVAALLAVPFHFLFEDTVWPTGIQGWLAILAMGLGPMGLAFFLWDYGVKKGNLRLLGTLSYAAPILSTGLLMMAGRAEPSLFLALAVCLVVGGAAIASRRARD